MAGADHNSNHITDTEHMNRVVLPGLSLCACGLGKQTVQQGLWDYLCIIGYEKYTGPLNEI